MSIDFCFYDIFHILTQPLNLTLTETCIYMHIIRFKYNHDLSDLWASDSEDT